ncbi:hypothetical protein Ddye_024119 [Dipteronia dyeriana]|uniref:Uncharacterized protein n=1 Tax=Dipteronia dyeriana TaxID=168575 RepID=A0AAD9TUD3_9ROSI|nr:hypothetical protein Ddye_024119 [Dipteronia dyeriana]
MAPNHAHLQVSLPPPLIYRQSKHPKQPPIQIIVFRCARTDKSIADYMQGIKNILDNLELIGYPVDDDATNSTTNSLITKPTFNVMRRKEVVWQLRHSLIKKLLTGKGINNKETLLTIWGTNTLAIPAVITTTNPSLAISQTVVVGTLRTMETNFGPIHSHSSPPKINGAHPRLITILHQYSNYVTRIPPM